MSTTKMTIAAAVQNTESYLAGLLDLCTANDLRGLALLRSSHALHSAGVMHLQIIPPTCALKEESRRQDLIMSTLYHSQMQAQSLTPKPYLSTE